MTTIEALILGIVQGLTEFFPVSSSGHLVLVESILGLNPPGVTFEVLVHCATLVAVLAVGAATGQRESWRYIGKLFVGSIPAGAVGVFAGDAIAATFDVPIIAAVNLLVTGGIVYSTRWLIRRDGRPEPGWGDALLIGFAQAFAILPGISRSGATVAVALWARTGRTESAEFSFLLSVPAIVGATLLEVPRFADPARAIPAAAMVVAVAAAFAAGIAAIVLFVRWLEIGRFHLFAYYCWAVGGLFLLYHGLAS